MAHEVLVPPLGQTTDTVILATWYRQMGDQVTQGEPLFAIETDKATLDIEAQASGVLAAVSAQAGDTVMVLSSIGTLLQAGEHIVVPPTTTDSDKKRVQVVNPASFASAGGNGAVSPAASTPRQPGQRVFISPRAKRLADTTGIAWQILSGTGPEGAIVERDVRRALATTSTPLATSVTLPQQPIEVADSMQVGRPVTPAVSIGSGQLATEVDISALVILCERLSKRSLMVTVADFVAYIAIKAQQRHMEFTCTSMGVLITRYGNFEVKAIVDTANKSLLSLSSDIASMTTGMSAKESESAEPAVPALVFADLGRFGLDTANGFHGAQDSTMLAIGRMRNHRDNSQTMWVTLSYMPAVLSDRHAIQFLNTVVQLIEDPDLLF
jgi:pyruvate dehydrogenase E2 component (dihydrolipoamide acetyltransferase)